MLYLTLTFLILFKLILAAKDGISFLLREQTAEDTDLHMSRLGLWHGLGAALDAAFTVVLCIAYQHWFEIIVQSILIRLVVYDITFNYISKFNYKYIGNTAWSDKLFLKIFGQDGAVKKSIFFLTILIIFTILVQR